MDGVPSANNYQGGFGTTLMAKVCLCPRDGGAQMFNGLITHSPLTEHMSILDSKITKTAFHLLTGN